MSFKKSLPLLFVMAADVSWLHPFELLAYAAKFKCVSPALGLGI
jgi:hypothetical protein